MNKHLKYCKTYPDSVQKFYCSVCDQAKVDSNDESTGDFFIQYGHTYKSLQGYTGEGDYVGVMFALCKACQE